MRRLVIAASVVALVALGGCGEDEDTRPATFAYIWPTIIRPNCTTSGCHTRHTATFGLQLDTPEGAFIDLVGSPVVGPQQTTGPQNYVKPGDPFGSKLLYQLRGDGVKRMPPDGPLPDRDIDLIERWILAGAPE